jgi:hypothetical protein
MRSRGTRCGKPTHCTTVAWHTDTVHVRVMLIVYSRFPAFMHREYCAKWVPRSLPSIHKSVLYCINTVAVFPRRLCKHAAVIAYPSKASAPQLGEPYRGYTTALVQVSTVPVPGNSIALYSVQSLCNGCHRPTRPPQRGAHSRDGSIDPCSGSSTIQGIYHLLLQHLYL